MSLDLNQPFCPLYREAITAAPWRRPESAHAGLLFDKFADAWRYDRDQLVAFDKGNRRKKDREKREDEREGYWIKTLFPERYAPSASLLAEACARQRQLVEALGGKAMILKNASRFVTGMGREHPLENGFVWHHTLGVPYLPGSSLKGMLRAWLRERDGATAQGRSSAVAGLPTEPPASTEGLRRHSDTGSQNASDSLQGPDCIRRWFGTQGHVGQLILLDMLPAQPPRLTVDVMTPHYGPYYLDAKGETAPGDWHSPVPITFLVVEEGASWQIGILPAPHAQSLSNNELTALTDMLVQAFEFAGAGAKTAVGYGRFVRDQEAELRIEEQEKERRAAQQEQERQAAEQAAFEAELAKDSEPLRRLKRLQREQNWQRSAGDQRMMQALHELADSAKELPQDCIDWIRNLLESIPNYKGVWDNPEATKGKAKKPKYSSAKIRELVKKLKDKNNQTS